MFQAASADNLGLVCNLGHNEADTLISSHGNRLANFYIVHSIASPNQYMYLLKNHNVYENIDAFGIIVHQVHRVAGGMINKRYYAQTNEAEYFFEAPSTCT